MTDRNRIVLGVVLLAALAVLGSIMGRQIPPRIDLPYDLQSTGLAAEFARNPEEVNAVVGSDRRYAPIIAREQYIDFAFIPCYVALFLLLAWELRRTELPGAIWLAIVAALFAMAAGAFDVAENFAILRVMNNPAVIESSARTFSIPKWAFVFATMIVESPLFLAWPGLRGRWRAASIGVGALFLFAGASGLMFSLLLSFNDIAWSAGWMSWAMVGLLLFLLGRLAVRLRY